MMYLTRTFPEGFAAGNEQRQYTNRYPGQLGEAVFQMEMWESAVDSLVSKGLVDPDRVGVIGFSRTGWQVEFDLVHSKVHYAAATAADNIQYSYGEYLTARSTGRAAMYEQMYGGPPYGRTLKDWLDYSVSFNLEKLHTPLLMETMGYGVHDNVAGMTPSNLIGPSEIFTGLSRLESAVEWYYYPDEGHQPVHPRARLASLERNLDWYRFWLQDYERPNPDDPDQYGRWEQMRKLMKGAVRIEEK